MIEEHRKKERVRDQRRVYRPETFPNGPSQMNPVTVLGLVIEEAQRALPGWDMAITEQDEIHTKVVLESKDEALTFEYCKR